jgi:hypothetical protein
MTGRHRKQAQWTLRIGGAVVAGAALTSTFALAAQAANASVLPTENAGPGVVAPTAAPEAAQHTKFLALAQTPVGSTLLPLAQDSVKAKRVGAKAAQAPAASKPAAKPNPAQAAQLQAAQHLASAQDVIALAEKQVGTKESGSGQTKFSQWYSRTPRAQETIDRDGGSRKAYLDASWCDMFVSWVASQSGGKTASTVGQDAWTIAHAKWFKAHGRWGSTPKPGAVVFFDWNGGHSIDGIDHVGYVASVGSHGNINTVEGNTDNAVHRRVRSSDQVVGYGYPDYAK